MARRDTHRYAPSILSKRQVVGSGLIGFHHSLSDALCWQSKEAAPAGARRLIEEVDGQ